MRYLLGALPRHLTESALVMTAALLVIGGPQLHRRRRCLMILNRSNRASLGLISVSN